MVDKIKIIHSKGGPGPPGVLFESPLSCNFIKWNKVKCSFHFSRGPWTGVWWKKRFWCSYTDMFFMFYKHWLIWFRIIKIIRSPLSCNNRNWVLRPYLKTSLSWGLMEEKNLFSSMDCVLLHLHSCCSDAELLLDCCSAPSRKCPIEY